MNSGQIIVLFNIFQYIACPYSPGGDEVQAGSVLLPASRRGRYLANIIRRQAVDGTGIKFNKDADRINAEAKKKVDVLSEELLPYIIAEQERRTTLYRRVMTAIQNGEKGVTIAELRNKPPLIIRKGLLYRCPANRAPKEPDGYGVLMCEDNIEPTQVMYDSCLSAEDKDLYVAENKYFFCNRHKVEGPDLPRNGSTVIGCAPMERTSLNYTSTKCALEDTDDVVVHYRYYPDRTYKFVTELDPDREVCDHWNPCQIGYIYSLPSPDQALLANELWHNYAERVDEYERDEIVPPIPEDSLEEWVPTSARNYTSSPRRLTIPDGYEFHRIKHSSTLRNTANAVLSPKLYSVQINGQTIIITLNFPSWSTSQVGPYYCTFSKSGSKHEKVVKFLVLSPSGMSIAPKSVELLHGQRVNSTVVPFRCNRCRLLNLMVRASDGNVYNVDNSRYRVKEFTDREGKQRQFLEMELEGMKPQDFGDYFLVMQNGDGLEERVKGITVLSPEKDVENVIKTTRLTASFEVGGHFDRTMHYGCDGCEITDILCNGESVLAAGRVSIIRVSNMISFNFPRFEDNHSCVYMGFFKLKERVYKKILAVIDNNAQGVTTVPVTVDTPKVGEQFEQEVSYSCADCTVEKVFVNGIPLQTGSRRTNSGTIAFFVASSTSITIRITEYAPTYEGVYQAVFAVGNEEVTKTIMEIKDPSEKTEEQVAGTTSAAETHAGETTAAATGATAAATAGTAAETATASEQAEAASEPTAES